MADIQVVTIGVQGPAGVSGSSVPATTTTLGGVIVGTNLTVLANGLLSANAATVTNLPFANITGKPSTLGGYNITDSYPLSGNPSGFLVASSLTPYALTSSLSVYLTSANAATTYLPSANFSFANIAGKPSTLGGYGISDGLLATTAASTYLAITTAASTYATTSSLSSYLLSATAASTYLAQTTAASTYALQATSIATGAGLTGGGSLVATRTLSLLPSGATAGTYGSGTTVPQVVVDTYGRITGVTNVAITAGGSYTLPVATTSQLGGVKQGSGVVIDAGGIISVSGSGGGTVTSVTGGTGITVTDGTTTPLIAINAGVVATLTGTQTLSAKTLASPTISGELFLNSVSLRQAGVLRQSGSAAMTAYEQLTGSVLDINVATDTTFTLNSGTALPAAWNITIVQTGDGKITIAGAGTYSVVGRNGLKTAGKYAVIGIFQTVPSGVFVVTGDTIA